MNGRAEAVIDFAPNRSVCRSNFPAASEWSPEGHAWDEHAADFVNKSAT